jgi:hypothetical protein
MTRCGAFPRDRDFESGFLQRRVYEPSVPIEMKAPVLAGAQPAASRGRLVNRINAEAFLARKVGGHGLARRGKFELCEVV